MASAYTRINAAQIQLVARIYADITQLMRPASRLLMLCLRPADRKYQAVFALSQKTAQKRISLLRQRGKISHEAYVELRKIAAQGIRTAKNPHRIINAENLGVKQIRDETHI